MTETDPQTDPVAELAPELAPEPAPESVPAPEPAAPAETDPILPPAPKVTQPPTADHIRLAEALVFASPEPVQARHLAALLPEDVAAGDVLRATQARYAGSGVELAEIAGGWQFRTAPDLAPRLTRVISRPRRLPRVAMETLAIIAWHQPVTRAQIEEIRGATLSQNTLDALLEAGIIRTAGHREVPGRPALWATTPQFLVQFGLKDLKELPKREELVNEQAAVLDGTLAPEEPVTLSLPLGDEAATEELASGESAPEKAASEDKPTEENLPVETAGGEASDPPDPTPSV